MGWLEPGGAERKLEETQDDLFEYDDVYPVKTAEALRNGSDEERIMEAVYDDYGYWMFVTPHGSVLSQDFRYVVHDH